MSAKVRLYRFYNINVEKWGKGFAMCDKHKEKYTVPNMLIVKCVADKTRRQCNICEQEMAATKQPNNLTTGDGTMGWTNVEEKLPEKGFGWFLCVWVYEKCQNIEILWYNKQAIHKWWHDTHGRGSLQAINVTHWMPLPKLPTQ